MSASRSRRSIQARRVCPGSLMIASLPALMTSHSERRGIPDTALACVTVKRRWLNDAGRGRRSGFF